MTSNKRSTTNVENLGVILLAAGYGTRLQRDLKAAPQFHALTTTPKPLLPVGGRVILDHWLECLKSFPLISSIVLITNAAHYQLYSKWAENVTNSDLGVHQFPIQIVSDGSSENANRLGAVSCMELAISELRKSNADKVIIIAGDTILPGIDLHDFVSQFADSSYNAATFSYPLKDIRDHVRRGMFKYEEKETGKRQAIELIEKPQTLAEVPSNFASAPVYMLKKSAWDTVSDYIKASKELPLDKRDAPGFWLRWLIPREPCLLFTVQNRIDIGGLQQYKDALCDMTVSNELSPGNQTRSLGRTEDEPAIGRAFPRVGFLGNPSDGYGGKVIAIAIASEGYAEVIATSSKKFSVSYNPTHELPDEFEDLNDFLTHVENRGVYYGARSLVVAASIIFARSYLAFRSSSKGDNNQDTTTDSSLNILNNCNLTYSTTIPARIGLSGSSALIIATLRALARYYNTSLEEINPDIKSWCELARSAESVLLGISCGLMDRVVQILEGCVAMDFTNGDQGKWEYRNLPEEALPEMWIASYDKERGAECSGKVHGNLQERYSKGDTQITNAVQELCQLVDQGQQLIQDGIAASSKELVKLINRNFELRVALVGADRVGEYNLSLISMTRKAGFASKMTGSGGCALCIPDPPRKLNETEIENTKVFLNKNGIKLRKVEVQKRRFWHV